MRALPLMLLLLAADASPLSESQVASLSPLIGEWNGIAQPRRGSAVGSSRETADWAFDFAGSTDPTAIEMTPDGNKVFESIRLQRRGDGLVAVVTPIEGDEPITIAASSDRSANESRWTFGGGDDPYRLTLRRLSDIRIVLLIEARDRSRFRRVTEIGYTRAGERLAVAGGGGRVCIVTGGRGTMEVQHDGKTYYVCCTGCAQAFAANPEKIIAQAKERMADDAAAETE